MTWIDGSLVQNGLALCCAGRIPCAEFRSQYSDVALQCAMVYGGVSAIVLPYNRVALLMSCN